MKLYRSCRKEDLMDIPMKQVIEVTDDNVPEIAGRMGWNQGTVWKALADAKDLGDRLYVAIPVKEV